MHTHHVTNTHEHLVHHASHMAHKACHRFLASNYINLIHKTQPIFHSEHGWVVEFSITEKVLKNNGIIFENVNNPNFHFYKLHNCRVNPAGSKDDLLPSSQPVTDLLESALYTQLSASSVNSAFQMAFTYTFDLSVTDSVTKLSGVPKTVFMTVCFPVHHH